MDLTLYLVTGRYDFNEAEFLSVIDAACKNGVTLVQLREKELVAGKFYDLALQVKAITDRYQIPLIINDRVDICLAVDAAGVHIGDDELPVEIVRAMIGPEKYWAFQQRPWNEDWKPKKRVQIIWVSEQFFQRKPRILH